MTAFRKGDVFQGTACFFSDYIGITPEGGLVGDDGPDIRWNTRGSQWGNWVGEGVLLSKDREEAVHSAHRTARSARFEHGRTVVTPFRSNKWVSRDLGPMAPGSRAVRGTGCSKLGVSVPVTGSGS
ncbi:hypothetical protein [Streptomyces sp. NPDC055632]